MNYNSENTIYFGKNGYPSKNLSGTTKGDKKSLIEKNRRIKILLSIAFSIFFSISNFILQLSYALYPFLWPDSFPLILILSLTLGSAVLNLIPLVYFINENVIDRSFNSSPPTRLFTTAVVAVLIMLDIFPFTTEGYSLPHVWICAFLSLLVFISSCIHGGYYCLKNRKK
jgi:hypothetical protein